MTIEFGHDGHQGWRGIRPAPMARRRDPDKPYFDIEGDPNRFSIPLRKWRELVFVGVLVRDGEDYVRDPSRPLPSFVVPDLFPVGVRFRVEANETRVTIHRIA